MKGSQEKSSGSSAIKPIEADLSEGLWAIASLVSKHDAELSDVLRNIASRMKTVCDSRAVLLHTMERILADLPADRDWLDPVIERAARVAIRDAEAMTKGADHE